MKISFNDLQRTTIPMINMMVPGVNIPIVDWDNPNTSFVEKLNPYFSAFRPQFLNQLKFLIGVVRMGHRKLKEEGEKTGFSYQLVFKPADKSEDLQVIVLRTDKQGKMESFRNFLLIPVIAKSIRDGETCDTLQEFGDRFWANILGGSNSVLTENTTGNISKNELNTLSETN